MNEKAKILVVDDEAVALKNLVHILGRDSYDITATQSGPKALQHLEQEGFDLVVTDLRMEKVDGMQLLRRAKELSPETEVLMITGYATVDSAIDAMRAGACHYITKPYKIDEVRGVVREALEKTRLRKENRSLRRRLQALQEQSCIISEDAAMKGLLALASQVAQSDSNIVITGESGTGKELLARFVHANSRRSAGLMLSINCGVFGEELLANELFGHEKGAFTGAAEAKAGLVEAASGGTLFLDEIAETTPSMQVKLLRVLQEREVQRLGSTRPLPVDVRFICATNRNLQEEVKAGHFRADLYYRINVVALHLPPLAARKGDIPLLVHHFIQKYALRMDKQVTDIAPEAADALMHYDFPGNVRELENIIERGVALAGGSSIEMAQLPEDLRGVLIRTYRRQTGPIPSLADQERDYILWVLEQAKNNRSEAARILGIDRVSLWRKLKRYGLEE